MRDNQLTKLDAKEAGAVLEAVVIEGDLAHLSPEERVGYYKQVCNSVGLNPMTRPFDYIKLNGKLTLYAKRDAADQLRQIHGVSVKIISKEEVDGLLIVHVAAEDKNGRRDEDLGAVSIAGLKGEARANAMAKAMTKAKRRVTLSICGLGWLDETEVESVAAAEKPKMDLDELFPSEEAQPEPAKPEPKTIDLDPIEADEPPAAEPVMSEPVPMYLGDETYLIDTPRQWYEEMVKQLNSLADNDELGSPRKRMTMLKELEQANEEGLGLIPEAGKEKLLDIRKELNRRLGAKAKKAKKETE
ncbi:MAG TPA: hypothetical protein DCG72_08985 [Gammaproteobacteria bacterium]|jgi:hypothetical protein|nr:hypothetical protein [Gammaproteobacteria bacterium]